MGGAQCLVEGDAREATAANAHVIILSWDMWGLFCYEGVLGV